MHCREKHDMERGEHYVKTICNNQWPTWREVFYFVRSGALCFQSHTSVTRQTFTHCNSIFRVFETFRSSWKFDYVFPSIVSTPFYESLGLHTAVCMVGHQSMGDVCRPPRQPPRRLFFCEGSSLPRLLSRALCRYSQWVHECLQRRPFVITNQARSGHCRVGFLIAQLAPWCFTNEDVFLMRWGAERNWKAER